MLARHLVVRLAVLALVLVSAPARGEDEDTFAADLARCRSLVGKEEWGAAVEAYGKLFADHPRDERVAAARRDIEDDLSRATFMRDFEEPDAKVLFGPEVTYFGKSSLKLRLACPKAPASPCWSRPSADFWLLAIRFQDKVRVDIPLDAVRDVGVMLCYDLEKKGGYLVLPAVRAQGGGRASAILRVAESGPEILVQEGAGEHWNDTVRITRESTLVKIVKGPRNHLSVKDRTYRGGYLGFTDHFPDGVEIEGVLDKKFYHQLVGGYRDAGFQAWLTNGWRPEDHLPGWLLDPETAPATSRPLPLPADARPMRGENLAELAAGCLSGDPAAARLLTTLASSQGRNTQAFLLALACFGTGSLKSAETYLESVIANAPGFALGRALRGLLHLRLGRDEPARADLSRARELDATLEWPWLGLALLAIREGDLDGATEMLGGAVEAGVRTDDIELLAGAVQRSRRGPLWTNVFTVETTHYVIKSDHSRELCHEVANALESAQKSYRIHFPEVVPAERKARVWVFGSREGFLGYARDRLQDLTWAAGAYDPRIRELVFFLPVDRTHFIHTVRHEGFHAFVHEVIEAAPPWFNEGCAEYFSCGSERYGGGLKSGALNDPAILVLREMRKNLLPLDELMKLTHREFLDLDLGLVYAQSWAVVHMFENTKDVKLAGLLRDYLNALREGLSTEEAYEKLLAPHAQKIERAFTAHLAEIL